MTSAALPHPLPLTPPEPGAFSLALLPDSQNYAEHQPETFRAQTEWIVAQRAAYNIQAVLHVGDLVNRNAPEQWANAAHGLRPLDAAEIPYLVAIGNHDYDEKADADRLATAFNALLPPSRYTAHPWWRGEFYEPGHSENSYCRLAGAGRDLLLLNLEFGPRQAVLDWAATVLRRFPADWAVLLTHSYLYIDGTPVTAGHRHNPKGYPLGPTAHDGAEVWDKLVRRHANLHWVQCGHHVGGHLAYRCDVGAGGTRVHQQFANWQQAPNHGDGWMQLLTLGPTHARVQSFSPTLGQVDPSPAGCFTVTL